MLHQQLVSCGILPGAIVTIGKEYDIDDETMIDALFTASAIGAIITRNATVSGAEGGCQAETGAAAAMASAGVVEHDGWKPRTSSTCCISLFTKCYGISIAIQ